MNGAKLDMFGPPHKVLRWASARAITMLGSCPGDFAAIDRALAAVRELLAFHEAHQRVEDAVVVQAIEARRPGASLRISEAHADHALAARALRTQIATVEREGAPAHALHELYLALTHFIADTFLHMYEEETLVAPLLEEAYSQAELRALHAKVATVLSPTELAEFATAMLPALSAAERDQIRR
ncbi:MAG TPA: hemerythrin domain-containing protein [Kofleriaceae bacterium]